MTKKKDDHKDIQQEEEQNELLEKDILAEKEEQLLRALADLQNVRRRAEDDRVRLPQIGAQNIAMALLPTLDNLELAIQNIPEKKDDWTKGVESIFSSLQASLIAQGLERIDGVGEDIDPEKHEVLMADPEAEEGKVSEVLQAGYSLKGKVIRAAKVKGGMQ